jgi:hypothetical protein
MSGFEQENGPSRIPLETVLRERERLAPSFDLGIDLRRSYRIGPQTIEDLIRLGAALGPGAEPRVIVLVRASHVGWLDQDLEDAGATLWAQTLPAIDEASWSPAFMIGFGARHSHEGPPARPRMPGRSDGLWYYRARLRDSRRVGLVIIGEHGPWSYPQPSRPQLPSRWQRIARRGERLPTEARPAVERLQVRMAEYALTIERWKEWHRLHDPVRIVLPASESEVPPVAHLFRDGVFASACGLEVMVDEPATADEPIDWKKSNLDTLVWEPVRSPVFLCAACETLGGSGSATASP